MISETTVAKAAGAAIGSSLALVFNAKTTPFVTVQRFIVGAIGGFIAAPVVIDYFDWKHTFDYWLSASALSGVLTYFILHLVFSGQLTERLTGVKKK